MKLYIARHGETTENKDKRILGNTPGTLTPEGKAQGRALATNINNLGIDFALASGLQRVKDSCESFDENITLGLLPDYAKGTLENGKVPCAKK